MSEAQKARPVMLVVLDGWGWREEGADNAVRLGKTPNFDRLWETCPHAFLRTSGRDVGLPDGQMGNSEVGHLNIGAGRVVMQDLPRIDEAIEDGGLAQNPALQEAITALKASGGTCHLIGLISPGGVHSHQNHAVALARVINAAGVPVRIHVITDGRDTPPQAAGDYVRRLRQDLPEAVGIATLLGRYYAMDRDKDGTGCRRRIWRSPRDKDRVSPTRFRRSTPHTPITSRTNSSCRPASAATGHEGRRRPTVLQLPRRSGAARSCPPCSIRISTASLARASFALPLPVGMASYSTELDKRLKTLFPPIVMHNLLGEVVAAAGRRQLRMAETEKYPHVTYFLNGGEETPNPGEERIMVPSPKVATYDLQPEMSAPELADKAVEAIGSGKYDLIVLNFANPDMVGHTGSLEAAIKAVETVDKQLGRIVDAVQKQGGALLVTADHGNCEMMRDPETGGPHTAHTTNPVPVFLVSEEKGPLADGRLADVAPTILALMRLPQPAEMTGHSLIRRDAAHATG